MEIGVPGIDGGVPEKSLCDRIDPFLVKGPLAYFVDGDLIHIRHKDFGIAVELIASVIACLGGFVFFWNLQPF